MEFGLKRTSWVYRGHHRTVDIVEFCFTYKIYVQTVCFSSVTDWESVVCVALQLCELPIHRGVESLPDHHLLKSLVEIIESRATRNCDICAASAALTTPQQQQQDDEKKKTKHWLRRARRSSHCCVKCEEFLCDSCARNHRLHRTTADHLVVSVTAMKRLCQVR